MRASCETLIFLFLLTVFPCSITTAHAQQFEVSSALNPVGSGARATGMGGAFIGIADDATAASWNPAGLVQLEKPEVSIVYSWFQRSQDYISYIHPESDGTNRMDSGGINFASAAYPFVLFRRNVVVSLNYQRLYDLHKNVCLRYIWDIDGEKSYDNIRFEQKGYLYAFSPAAAVQVVPGLDLGITVNFWNDYFGRDGWTSFEEVLTTGTLNKNNFLQKVTTANRVSFKGLNMHLGFLWAASAKLTLGGVYKTAFDARLKKKTAYTFDVDMPGKDSDIKSVWEATEYQRMKMPASYGLGLSYRHNDNLTLAADVYRTDWSRFSTKDQEGAETNPIDGAPLNEGRLADTTQLRLGCEYLFIREKKIIPFRAGIFYDPEPQRGGLDDFYGLSIGTGLSTRRFSFDASYQYRFGRNVSGDTPSVAGSSADIDQHTVMVSAIYYF